MLYLDIKKKLGNFTLNIKLEAGNEAMSLLGSSGCGKSMTLKCIAGIEKPDEGRIVLDGKVLFDSDQKINLSPQERNVGLLFQSYALFPNMTAWQNISMGIRTKDKKAKKEKVAETIRSFYLEGLENHYPHQLSGGQQQRVALARMLASEPKILMLDEPFSALDSHLRWKLEQEVDRIIHNFSGTTLFVSHNRDEVYRICDKVAVISNGKIEAAGDKWDLFNNPQTYSAALLTGCKNISRAEARGEGRVYAQDWDMELSVFPGNMDLGEIKYIGIRSHSIRSCESCETVNAFTCDTVRKIEDPFNHIFMVIKKGIESGEPLRWEYAKGEYGEEVSYPCCLEIPPKDILLLK